MSKLGINTGSTPNDGTGDSLLSGAIKINSNFNEIYTTFGDGSTFNDQVTSIVAGTNVSISSSTGDVTINATGGGGGGAGINVQDEGVALATTATTLNFVGSGVAASGTGATKTITITGGGGGGISLTDLSVTTAGSPSQLGALAYDNSTGVFTFTPADVQGQSRQAFSVGTPNNPLQVGAISYNNGTGEFTYTPPDLSSYVQTNSNASLQQLNVSGIATVGTALSLDGGVSLEMGTPSDEGGTFIMYNDSDRFFEIFPGTADKSISIRNNGTNAGDIRISSKDAVEISGGGGGAGDYSIRASADGAAELYQQVGGVSGPSELRLTTTDSGITVTGIVTATNAIIGAGSSTNSVESPALTLSHNNPTVVGTSGTTGEIKQIGGAPFFYDGAVWREFVLATGTPVTRREDSDWDNVMLRLDFEDSTTNIADIENKKVLATGQDQKPDSTTPATVDFTGSPVKYGSKALRFNGTGGGTMNFAWMNRIDSTNDRLFDFEGAWTIEMWLYITDAPGSDIFPIVSASEISNTPTDDWALLVEESGTTNNIEFKWYNVANGDSPTVGSGTEIAEYTQSSILNQWNHIALVRDSSDGSMHFYLNGSESNQTSGNALIDTNVQWGGTTEYLSFGYHYRIQNSTNHYAKMVIDDVRISKSVRYTSNFTAPSAALPIAGTASTVYTPPGSKQGEIALGNSPTWTGMSGVTASKIGSGHYRATFSSAFSNANDYVITTSMNDHIPSTTAVGIGVTRYTGYADFIVTRVSDSVGIDSGSLAIDLIKK